MNNAIILCDAAPAAPASAGEAPASAAPVGGVSVLGEMPWLPMLLILGIFYFMMIRPQQRKEKERRKMIEELRAGAKVIFAGGLMGTISEATDKTFKVEIAPGTIIEIARSCVTGVVSSEGEAQAVK